MKRKIKTVQFKKSGIRLFIYFLLCLSLILVWIIRQTSSSSWDGKRRFTVVVQNIAEDLNSDLPVAVFSIEPRESRAIFLLIPGNTMLDVPYGYQTYIASSVYKLGELDGKRGGGLLLAKSTETTLGILIDGYLVFSNKDFFSLPKNIDELRKIKKNYFSFSGFFSFFTKIFSQREKIKSNITFIDKFRLWNEIRKLRPDQINYQNLENSNICEEKQLPDQTLVKVISKELFDGLAADNFQDTVVRSENISLEVVNAANQEKLASDFGRVLSHLGAKVILHSTSSENISEACILIFSDKRVKSSRIFYQLTKSYNCLAKENSQLNFGQADIKIILGEKFVR